MFRLWIERKESKKVSIIFISLYPILSEILYYMVQIGERVGNENPTSQQIFPIEKI